jgi:hypothetical protein
MDELIVVLCLGIALPGFVLFTSNNIPTKSKSAIMTLPHAFASTRDSSYLRNSFDAASTSREPFSPNTRTLSTHSRSGSGAGNGLKAQYYDDENFTNLKLTRTDATIDFGWGADSPDRAIAPDTFSVRWSGKVEPLYSEIYLFRIKSDDGTRLWVNGRKLSDTWDQAGLKDSGGIIVLEAGKQYDIQLEYRDNQGNADAQLFWSSQRQAPEIIPQSQLYSETIVTNPSSSNLRIRYAPHQAIAGLSYNNASLIAPESSEQMGFRVASYALKRSDGTIQEFSSDANRLAVLEQPNAVTWIYSWGRVSSQYVQQGDQLNISINVINTSSSETIDRIEIWPLLLNFPTLTSSLGTGFVWGIEGPPVKVADFGEGLVAVANANPSLPLTIGYGASLNQPGYLHPVFVSTGLPWYGLDQPWPRISRPIAPGASDQFNISLRFGPSGSTDIDLASDVYRDYATTFPFQLQWSDRRPIGRLIPADHTRSGDFSTNPRGWLNNPGINILTEAGRQEFRNVMMAYADSSIANLKAINAQGVILWDVEGEEYAAITYVGDPRLTSILAPEMDSIANEFFQKFRDAGLRVGVTIRPQATRLRQDAEGASFYQEDAVDVFQELNDKITYANQRWGATLFYIDSNVGKSAYDPTVFQRLMQAHPEVLLIPEWQTPHSFAYTAPYDSVNQWYYEYPSVTARQELYPEAFQVLVLGDDPLDATQHSNLVDRVRSGDILMVDTWFWHPAQETLLDIYRDAGRYFK